jgi:hypothetical protein
MSKHTCSARIVRMTLCNTHTLQPDSFRGTTTRLTSKPADNPETKLEPSTQIADGAELKPSVPTPMRPEVLLKYKALETGEVGMAEPMPAVAHVEATTDRMMEDQGARLLPKLATSGSDMKRKKLGPSCAAKARGQQLEGGRNSNRPTGTHLHRRACHRQVERQRATVHPRRRLHHIGDRDCNCYSRIRLPERAGN